MRRNDKEKIAALINRWYLQHLSRCNFLTVSAQGIKTIKSSKTGATPLMLLPLQLLSLSLALSVFLSRSLTRWLVRFFRSNACNVARSSICIDRFAEAENLGKCCTIHVDCVDSSIPWSTMYSVIAFHFSLSLRIHTPWCQSRKQKKNIRALWYAYWNVKSSKLEAFTREIHVKTHQAWLCVRIFIAKSKCCRQLHEYLIPWLSSFRTKRPNWRTTLTNCSASYNSKNFTIRRNTHSENVSSRVYRVLPMWMMLTVSWFRFAIFAPLLCIF